MSCKHTNAVYSGEFWAKGPPAYAFICPDCKFIAGPCKDCHEFGIDGKPPNINLGEYVNLWESIRGERCFLRDVLNRGLSSNG